MMKSAPCLLAGLWLLGAALAPASAAAASAAAPALARELDPEEQVPGLPDVVSGLVYRVPGISPLILDSGAGVAADVTVVLVAEPGADLEGFFAGASPRVVVTAVIDDILHARAAACALSQFSDLVLECRTGRGGAFELDRDIAAPDLMMTLSAPTALADDPADGDAGTVTLVPAPGGMAWSLLLPPAP